MTTPNPQTANTALDVEEIMVADAACSVCGGDGKETCTNPDHRFIDAIGGETARLGCPVCRGRLGYKVPNGGDCDHCNGTGREPADCPTCEGRGVVASVGFIDPGIPYPEADTCPHCNGSGRATPPQPGAAQ